MTVAQIKEQLDTLAVAERAELAHYLLLSLEDEPLEEDQAAVDAAWADEIKRRTAEIRSGKEAGVPAEVVFARLREKLK
jgi:putative addiction module component (TIGR02574 family)